jgi:hypothetical protein
MIDIQVAADLKEFGNGFKSLSLNYDFPGCGCPIIIETGIIHMSNPSDFLEKELRKVNDRMRVNTKCPICGAKWTEALPFIDF